jgi:hypothetical protein
MARKGAVQAEVDQTDASEEREASAGAIVSRAALASVEKEHY